jgi:UDP-N-acetyl-D-glucosamine dehydrogenase
MNAARCPQTPLAGQDVLAATLHQKLTDRTAKVGVVGLGYVGLPLAVEFARAGFRTTGIELDPRKVAAINAGPFLHSGCRRVRRRGVPAGRVRLSATAEPAAVADLDTINICVPYAAPQDQRP